LAALIFFLRLVLHPPPNPIYGLSGPGSPAWRRSPDIQRKQGAFGWRAHGAEAAENADARIMESHNQQNAAAPWPTELESRAALQIYPPGVTLLRQGAAAPEVYALQRGLVKLAYTAANGRECLFGLRTAGDWLGGAAAVLQEAAPCSAITVTECELYRLPAAVYLDWLQADADFAWRQQFARSRELTGQMQQTGDLLGASARQRLEQALWRLARELEPQGKRNVRLLLPLQQQELAGLITVTPSHLSRLFKELEADGLLQRDNGWLLPAPHKLWRGR
jgi:CRP-like cAMP-binding protein